MPIAPAPYAAPAAYYFPRIPRMSAVEVSKGPAAIKYGPQTVAGAIGMFSSPIPDDDGRRTRRPSSSCWAATSTRYRGHGLVGGYVETGRAYDVGLSLETLQESSSDGFKELDSGGDTGFRIQDYVAKVALRPGAGSDASAVARAQAAVLGRGVRRDLRRPDARRLPRRSAAALPRQPARRARTSSTGPTRRRTGSTSPTARPDDDRVSHEDRARLVQAQRRPQCGQHGLHEPERDPRESRRPIRPSSRRSSASPARRARRARCGCATTIVTMTRPASRPCSATRSTGSGAAHQLEASVRYHEDEEDRFQNDDRYQMTGGGCS